MNHFLKLFMLLINLTKNLDFLKTMQHKSEYFKRARYILLKISF